MRLSPYFSGFFFDLYLGCNIKFYQMKNIFIIQFLLICLLSVSCSTDDDFIDDEGGQSTQVTENPNPAANNSEIIAEYLLESNKSTISKAESYNNEIYAIGKIDGNASIIKLNTSGGMIWSKSTGLNGGSFTIVNDIIFATGNYGTNENGENDRAKVIAYDLSGNFLAEYIFSETAYSRTIINAIASVSVTDRIALGGFVQNGNTQYPYVVSISFNNNEILQYAPRDDPDPNNGSIRLNYPKQRIINIGSKDGYIYYVSNGYSQLPDENSEINITKLDLDTSSDYFNTIYSVNIAADNPQHEVATYTTSGIIFNNNEIYISGRSDDDKTPAPGNGGYWDSGFVAKVIDNGTSGNLEWKRTVNVSNKSDRFYGAAFNNNALYLFGNHSGLIYTSSQISFSNGLITKMDTNGNVIYSKTFGDKTKKSLFQSGLVMNGNVYGFGYSGSSENSSEYQAWIVRANL